MTLESHAKYAAASALRATEQLSFESWVKLERAAFKDISKRLISSSEGKDDLLEALVSDLERARTESHEFRHIVVHACWSEGPSGVAQAYDYGRKLLLDATKIDDALHGCARLKEAAHRVSYRTAELVEAGVFPERPDGPGLSIRTKSRPVRL